MSELSEDFNSDVGNVQVHKTVIQEIVDTVVKDMDGVDLGTKRHWTGMLNNLIGNPYPGIKVDFQPNNEAIVDVQIYVRYGLNITNTARHLQEQLKTAIEKLTDVSVKQINISVHGVFKEG